MSEKLAEFLSILFGFRKMLVIFILFAIGIVFRLKGLVNGAEMVDLFKTTAISFMAANGVSKIVSAVQQAKIPGMPTPAPDSPTAAPAGKVEAEVEISD